MEKFMEDFVNTIKNNTEISCEVHSSNKLKRILNKILAIDSEINIVEEFSIQGKIKFEIKIDSLGLDSDEIFKNEKILNTRFVANFLGEIFVREHINDFVNILLKYKDSYLSNINKYTFNGFGMWIYRDRFIFTFCPSLIQTILNEKIKMEI